MAKLETTKVNGDLNVTGNLEVSGSIKAKSITVNGVTQPYIVKESIGEYSGYRLWSNHLAEIYGTYASAQKVDAGNGLHTIISFWDGVTLKNTNYNVQLSHDLGTADDHDCGEEIQCHEKTTIGFHIQLYNRNQNARMTYTSINWLVHGYWASYNQ